MTPLFFLLTIYFISEISTANRLRNTVYLMDKFHTVTNIMIDFYSSDEYVFISLTSEDKDFKNLNPFTPPTGGLLSRSEKRMLQKQATERFAIIHYYNEDTYLFSVTVYNFLNHPFPKDVNNPDIKTSNVFIINDFYALGFIDSINYMAKFKFNNWDELDLHYCR